MKARHEVATFLARWDGHCFDCEQGIHRGTLCRWDDQNRPAHAQCPTERPVAICPRCFLTEPCGCDD